MSENDKVDAAALVRQTVVVRGVVHTGVRNGQTPPALEHNHDLYNTDGTH